MLTPIFTRAQSGSEALRYHWAKNPLGGLWKYCLLATHSDSDSSCLGQVLRICIFNISAASDARHAMTWSHPGCRASVEVSQMSLTCSTCTGLAIPTILSLGLGVGKYRSKYSVTWRTCFSLPEIHFWQIKTIWGTTSQLPEWPSLVSVQITSAREGVEKRESSYMVGGNVSWYNHCGKQ